MKNLVEEQITIKVIGSVWCDLCDDNLRTHNRDYAEIDHNFGYHSSLNGKRLKMDICDKCLEEMVKKHNIELTQGIYEHD